MSEFQEIYLALTLYVVGAALTMIVTYSLSYPWWREHLGRMVVAYALAEVSMAVLLCLAIVFRIGPAWFRTAWFALQATVGSVFLYQTRTIRRLRRERRDKEMAS